MPLTDDIIRRLAQTSQGRGELDRILSQFPGITSPLIKQGPMRDLVPGQKYRPVLTGQIPKATLPTAPAAPSGSMIDLDPGFAEDLTGSTPLSKGFVESPASAQQPGPMPQPATGSGLWDRVKGFFDPDEPQSPDEELDDGVSSAAWAGAAQAAAQTAQDYRASPIQVLSNALAGYSGAKTRARSDLKKEAREDRLADLRERGLTAEATRLENEATQRQRILDVIGGIEDPKQRQAAFLNPEAFGTQLAKQAFPDPEKLIEVDGGIYDPNLRQFVVQPKGPEPKVFGDSTGGYFTLGPNGPQRLVQGLGREAKAPVPQYEISNGVRLNKFTGATELIPGAGDVPEIGDLQRYAASLPAGSPERAQVDKLIENKLRPPQGNEPPEIIQLQNIRDGLKPDDPRRAEVQAVIEKLGKTGEGASIGTPSGAVPRLIELNQRVIDAGRNFGVLTPREQSEYRFLLAQEAAPKQTLDPGTGQAVTIPSDVSMFVKPPPLDAGADVAADPTMAPIPSPVELPGGAPGAPPPGLPMVEGLGGMGGGAPGAFPLPQLPGVPQLPVPGATPQPPMAVGAPMPPEMGGPPPGIPMTTAEPPAPSQVPFNPPPVPTRVQGATKQQIEDYTKANKAVGTLKTATNRARELLKAQGGRPFIGAAASQMEVVVNQIVTALGQQSDAGTMQPSDIDRYKGMVGDPTSLTGFLSNATGLRSFEAVIGEMDSQAEQGMFKKAIDAGQSSIRTSDGRQVPVYTSDEAMNKALPTLKKGDRVITPDGQLMEAP